MYYNARQFARQKMVEAIQASRPDCFKCSIKMFIKWESRNFIGYRCSICGKELTFKKRGKI
jgi:DNA-directed RNA polymerase subunit RPC12/RpoP